MSQTPQQQGTTPEILQHYLTAGIDVQVKTGWGGGLDVLAGKLVGLCPTEKDPVRLEMVNQGGIKTFLSDWHLTDCLPILRPFSALCEPLEDGTVPAVEVAKLVAGNASTWRIEIVGSRRLALQDESGYQVIMKDMISPRIGWSIEAYSGRALSALLDVLAAYDYLRCKHFALPVNGRPLLEGVDYIPKTSSAAPIDKNTAL